MLAALEPTYCGFFHAEGGSQLGLRQIVLLPKADHQPSYLFSYRKSQPGGAIARIAGSRSSHSGVVGSKRGWCNFSSHACSHHNKIVKKRQ